MTIEDIKEKLGEAKFLERESYIESFNSSLVGNSDRIDPLDISGYAWSNYGHLTSSKFKCFIECSMEYYMKYELLLPAPFPTTGNHFTLGTAFDSLRTLTLLYGDEEGTRQFMENYYIEIKALKKDYYDKLIADGHLKADIKDLGVDELKAIYYNGVSHKNKLTYNDWNKLMFMMKETHKNARSLELNGEFEHQKFFSYEYTKNGEYAIPIKFAGTLDRWRLGRIRDWKTTSRLEYILRVVRNTPASLYESLEKVMDDYGYYIQLGFYDMLTRNEYPDQDNEMFLDFVSTTKPFSSYSLKINTDRVKEIIETIVLPGLDMYEACLVSGDWSHERYVESEYYCYCLDVRDEEPLEIL